jgi:hypothetical protein
VQARLDVKPRLNEPNPHFEVTVRMTEPVDGKLPTGFAATLLAGFRHAPGPKLVPVRVTVDGVLVNNALKPTVPGVPTPAGWKLQTNVNGEWQEVAGLEQVAAGAEGQFFPVHAVFEQLLPRDGTLRIHADAASTACVDTLFGQSLLADLVRFGFDPANPATLPAALALGETCLAAVEHNSGSIDVTFAGPRFGARQAPYVVASQGGEVDGAYALRFQIERIDDDSREAASSRFDLPGGKTWQKGLAAVATQ